MSERWMPLVATAGMSDRVGVTNWYVLGRNPNDEDRAELLSEEWLRCGYLGQIMIRSCDVAVVDWSQIPESDQ